jgi:heme/copper-type cytochrome/quinol oxidase subunit 4
VYGYHHRHHHRHDIILVHAAFSTSRKLVAASTSSVLVCSLLLYLHQSVVGLIIILHLDKSMSALLRLEKAEDRCFAVVVAVHVLASSRTLSGPPN